MDIKIKNTMMILISFQTLKNRYITIIPGNKNNTIIKHLNHNNNYNNINIKVDNKEEFQLLLYMLNN